jgi:hypothetical protein
MRMSLHQPSNHMVVLIPLDREARDWLHTMWWDGAPVQQHMPPCVAAEVLDYFTAEGGQLVPH